MHEIFHIIGCIILNVRISKISFGLQESYVKHEQAGPVRMSLIALAPFYLGAAVGVLLFMLANKTYYSVKDYYSEAQFEDWFNEKIKDEFIGYNIDSITYQINEDKTSINAQSAKECIEKITQEIHAGLGIK